MAEPVIVELTDAPRTFMAMSVPPNVAERPLIDPATTDLVAPETFQAPPSTEPAEMVPKVPTEARRLAPIRPTADEAADLYFPRKGTSLGYRHFGTLADALEHVRENLTPGQRAACVIQVGERRLVPGDVARLLLREPVQPMAAG